MNPRYDSISIYWYCVKHRCARVTKPETPGRDSAEPSNIRRLQSPVGADLTNPQGFTWRAREGGGFLRLGERLWRLSAEEAMCFSVWLPPLPVSGRRTVRLFLDPPYHLRPSGSSIDETVTVGLTYCIRPRSRFGALETCICSPKPSAELTVVTAQGQ